MSEIDKRTLFLTPSGSGEQGNVTNWVLLDTLRAINSESGASSFDTAEAALRVKCLGYILHSLTQPLESRMNINRCRL